MSYECPLCGEVFDSAKSRGLHRRWNHTNPWEDEEKLRALYVDEQMSIPDIADKWDCGTTTVEQWLDKHSIDKRDRGGLPNDHPLKDAQELRRLYWEEGLSQGDLAERFDVYRKVVSKYMDQHGIDARLGNASNTDMPWQDKDRLERLYLDEQMTITEIAEKWDCGEGTISRWLSVHGTPRHFGCFGPGRMTVPYSMIYHREDGQNHFILVHRLVAYAHGELEFEDLFGSNLVVHHKNGVKWINSPENLEVMTAKEHTEYHHKETG